MGRAKETKRMRDEAREARKSDRLRKAAEKFSEEREHTAPALRPMNKKQEYYLHLLKTKQLVIATGLFGTGKSFMAAAYAADLLRKNEIDRIIVCRPNVECGSHGTGFKPGGVLQKNEPFLKSILETLKKRLGPGAYSTLLGDGQTGRIEVQEVATIRGRDFSDRCIILVDEFQLTTCAEALAIATRLGEHAQMICMGDLRQNDLKGTSGLQWLIDFVTRHEINGVGIVDFDEPEDVVRSGIGRLFALGLMTDRNKGVWTPEAGL